MGAACLDLAQRLDEIEAVTVMFFHAGSDREDIGIEDDVFCRKSIGDHQLVGAFTDIDLALRRICLAGFVKGHDHSGSTVIAAFADRLKEWFLPFLQADRIDDRLARNAFEPRFDHFPLGTVDHYRNAGNIGFGCDQLEKSGHGLD